MGNILDCLLGFYPKILGFFEGVGIVLGFFSEGFDLGFFLGIFLGIFPEQTVSVLKS